MSFDVRYLTLSEAGRYLGRSVRWMRRHWPDLVREGCHAYRVPKSSPKGQLMFLRAGLDEYMERCRILPSNLSVQDTESCAL